jgi:hypothetical protein
MITLVHLSFHKTNRVVACLTNDLVTDTILLPELF